MLVRKIYLVGIYLTLLVLLAHICLFLSWAWSLLSRVDLAQLSINQLKGVLELRGVSHKSALEKTDLIQLVGKTGSVTCAELDTLEYVEKTPVPQDTMFKSGDQFTQRVEKNVAGGVWLVKVMGRHDDSDNSIKYAQRLDTMWSVLQDDMAKSGIHAGVLDCSLDSNWCRSRGWTTSRLILAVPRVYRDKAFIQTYSGRLQPDHVMRWVVKTVQQDIPIVLNAQKFKDKWMTSEPGLRVVLLTEKDKMPEFFVSLRAFLPLTVQLGVFRNTTEVQNLNLAFNLSKPRLLFIAKEGVYQYGDSYGECFAYSCVETFLMFWYPSPSNLLSASIIAAIVFSLLGVFVEEAGGFWSVVVSLVIKTAVVLGLWALLTSDDWLLPLSVTLDTVRFFTTSSLAGVLRRSCILYIRNPYLFVANLLISICIHCLFGYMQIFGNSGNLEKQ